MGGQSHAGLMPREASAVRGHPFNGCHLTLRGGGCKWDLRTVTGIHSQLQVNAGQAAHLARAALSFFCFNIFIGV